MGVDAAPGAPDGPSRWSTIITSFLENHLQRAGAAGVVIGASGGLDSAVVTALAVRSLGADRVLPILLPAGDSSREDAAHAKLSCQSLGLTPLEFSIEGVLAGAESELGPLEGRVRGNVKARARMMILYAEAQKRNYLVCGTGNKSEILTGYFTKHGDGGVDLQPIGDLYKTQVRELASYLGVPEPIIQKPPSAGLYPGQTDEADMGLAYPDLDAVLRLIELNHDAETITRKTGLSPAVVAKVEAMVRRTEHKRHLALIPKLGARTVGVDWRRSVHWDA